VFLLALMLAAAQILPAPLFPRIQMPGVKGETLEDGWYLERSFVELDAIRYEMAFTNNSTAPLVIDQVRLRDVFSVRLIDAAIPLNVRWLDPAGSFTKVPASLSTPDSVQIDPRMTATWTMVIQRADGQRFTSGDHRLMVTMGDLRPVVSSPGGGTWGGRVADRGLWLRVVSVAAP
jgi:hypothetical protein